MINKVVGYGGHKSYSEQPYPTLKQGKELQLKNEIWSSTKRDADRINPLDNYNHYHTIYQKSHLENTGPKDYHPEHVQRGSNSTLNFAGNSLTKAYDQIEAEKTGESAYRNGFTLLKTGTEHWKTNYQGSISNAAEMSKTMNQSAKDSKLPLRSQSTGKTLNKNLIDEELSKALSYKNRPYINNTPTGLTDYRFNYG